MTMLDLIARLEAAIGPDRRIDAMIWSLEPCEEPDCLPQIHRLIVERMLAGGDDGECPAYTSSIDAALTLVPDECDRLINFRYGYASVWQSKETGKHGKWDATNLRHPAIALCAAALKARYAHPSQVLGSDDNA